MFSRIWRELISYRNLFMSPVVCYVLDSHFLHKMATVVERYGFLSVSEYFDLLLLF